MLHCSSSYTGLYKNFQKSSLEHISSSSSIHWNVQCVIAISDWLTLVSQAYGVNIFSSVISTNEINLLIQGFTTMHCQFRRSFCNFSFFSSEIHINHRWFLHVLPPTASHQDQWFSFRTRMGITLNNFVIATDASRLWSCIWILSSVATFHSTATWSRTSIPFVPFSPTWNDAWSFFTWTLLDQGCEINFEIMNFWLH